MKKNLIVDDHEHCIMPSLESRNSFYRLLQNHCTSDPNILFQDYSIVLYRKEDYDTELIEELKASNAHILLIRQKDGSIINGRTNQVVEEEWLLHKPIVHYGKRKPGKTGIFREMMRKKMMSMGPATPLLCIEEDGTINWMKVMELMTSSQRPPSLQLNIKMLPWKHILPYEQLSCVLFDVPNLQEFEAVSNYEGIFIRCSNLPAAHSQMIWHLIPRRECFHFCFHNNQQEQDIFQRLGSITESETIFIRALLHTVRTGRIISLCPLDQGFYVTLII